MQIRAEAGSIYYAENMFKVPLVDYDSSILRQWERRRGPIADEFNISHIHCITSGFAHSRPHWRNLVHMLCDCHCGLVSSHVTRPPRSLTGRHLLRFMIVARMMKWVYALRDRPWEEVRYLLWADREILIELEDGWED